MEENKTLKDFDRKLKKYISKSIYSKQLSECETLMTRDKLHLFYEQMQQHFYQQNTKKVKEERKLSLKNDNLFLLEQRQKIKMDTQPQIHRFSKKRSKLSICEKYSKQHGSCLAKDNKKTQQKSDITQNLEEFNFFVRKVKNPKVVRYISFKPSLKVNQTQMIFSSPKQKNSGSSNTNLVTTNFMERTSLFNKLKNQFKSNKRRSCFDFRC